VGEVREVGRHTVIQPTASTAATPAGGSLQSFFCAILLFDILWCLMALSDSYELSVLPSDEARAYFLTLSVSERLDALFELTSWPILLIPSWPAP
jgi:hypothetical protein